MAKRVLTKEPRNDEDKYPRRAMLYNETGSQIFTGSDAIKAALEDGWSDEPVPVAQTPQGDDPATAAQVQELNKALATMHDELKAAQQSQADAEAALAEAEDRAKAAEAENKKLAAALKKANASDSK